MKKKIITTLALLMAGLLVFLAACNNGTGGLEIPKGVPDVEPVITITMDDGNVIKAELYPSKAPNTVCNFLALVEDKYYDGLVFHRVMKDFMIQGGDAAGKGNGDAGFTIQGEFAENGFTKNDIPHEEGTLSMARTGNSMDSASTQFFICDADSENASALDGKYAAFGKVIEGIEHVKEYADRNTRTVDGMEHRPYDLPKIKTITADTKGAEFPAPIRDGEAYPKDYVANPTTAPPTTPAPTTAGEPTTTGATTAPTTPAPTSTAAPTTTENMKNRMTATIEMQDGGKIVLALYPDKAPNTVANFVALCNDKFYNGLIFHRVVQGFMIQGGDKAGNGRGELGWSIKGEFKSNEFEQNDLSFDAGVIGMARTSNDNNSAGSQFFITDTGNNKSSLDDKYAAFGMVIEGMDVVRRIAGSVMGTGERPLDPPVIKTITVDTKGQTVPKPERDAAR